MTMSDDGRSLLGAAIALRAALEQAGDALATPRVAHLLESEAGLAAALAVLPTGDAERGGSRDQVLRELARARQELDRCRRLGASLHDTMIGALGRPADYGPDGRRFGDDAARSAGTLKARG